MRFKHAIIVGASSGMGEEMARQLAAEGCKVALLARREGELKSLADEINSRALPPGGEAPAGAETARIYAHDVTCAGEVPALFQQICRDLGGLDLFIYAAGVMPRITEDEYCFEKDRAMVEVNLLGAIAWINEAAQRLERAGAGTIVGISSVAGDRGRRGQPVYCTTKAALNTYLEAVRNRVSTKGVSVVTIKPGPVHTPMTQGLDKLPMAISAPEAARQILNAARHGAHTAYVPGKWRFVMFILRSIPSSLFRRMKV